MQGASFKTPEALLDLVIAQGGESYFGEPVTVLEHSLETAYFALKAKSADALIVAALLHDVGHLFHHEGEDVAEQGIDTHHEKLAEQLLGDHLPKAVTEPIRMHVAAKRYLCYADSAYLEALSPSSLLSLGLQGGPMSAEEAESFVVQPFSEQAVQLRRWDDEAKIPDLAVPDAGSYLSLVKSLWR